MSVSVGKGVTVRVKVAEGGTGVSVGLITGLSTGVWVGDEGAGPQALPPVQGSWPVFPSGLPGDLRTVLGLLLEGQDGWGDLQCEGPDPFQLFCFYFSKTPSIFLVRSLMVNGF